MVQMNDAHKCQWNLISVCSENGLSLDGDKPLPDPVPTNWQFNRKPKVSKIFRLSVRVSKMNALARAQLTFQMLTLLQKYLYRESQY